MVLDRQVYGFIACLNLPYIANSIFYNALRVSEAEKSVLPTFFCQRQKHLSCFQSYPNHASRLKSEGDSPFNPFAIHGFLTTPLPHKVRSRGFEQPALRNQK